MTSYLLRSLIPPPHPPIHHVLCISVHWRPPSDVPTGPDFQSLWRQQHPGDRTLRRTLRVLVICTSEASVGSPRRQLPVGHGSCFSLVSRQRASIHTKEPHGHLLQCRSLITRELSFHWLNDDDRTQSRSSKRGAWTSILNSFGLGCTSTWWSLLHRGARRLS